MVTHSSLARRLALRNSFSGKFIWASNQENLSSGFANNKGAGQPTRPRRLICAFVIRFLESFISHLATRKISDC